MFRSVLASSALKVSSSASASNIKNFRFLSTLKVDSLLVKKLKGEIKYEKSENPVDLSQFDSQFKALEWKLIDKAGSNEITIQKQFNNEKITAIFSTDSLEEQEDLEEFAETDAAKDKNNEEEDQEPETPIAVSIIIEKEGSQGALEIATTLQASSFFIDSLGFHHSKALAKDETAEGDWKRRMAYAGPPFNNLDEEVIEHFHEYIEKRGFDNTLAELIGDYLVEKEQKEYVDWLQNVSEFIEA